MGSILMKRFGAQYLPDEGQLVTEVWVIDLIRYGSRGVELIRL